MIVEPHYADIVALASVLAGRKITRVTASDEEWTQRLVGQDTPPASADTVVPTISTFGPGEDSMAQSPADTLDDPDV